MKASKLCSAPVSMRFDGDDIHVLIAMVSFGIDKGEANAILALNTKH